MSTSDIDVIKGSPTKAAKIISAYRTAAAKTSAKTLVNGQERQAHLQKLQSDAQKKLGALNDEVAGASRRLLQGAGTKVTGSVAEQQLQETRMSKSWERLRGVLDSRGSDAMSAIQEAVTQAVASKDTDTLRMLRIELKPYLDAKGLDYVTDILPTLLKPGDDLIGAASAKSVTEDVGPRVKRVEQALLMAEHAISHSLDSSLQGYVPLDRDYDLPDFEKGELVEVAGVRPIEEKDDQGRSMRTAQLPDLEEGAA